MQACPVVSFQVFISEVCIPKLIFSKFIIMQNLFMFPFLQSFTVSCSFPLPLTAAKFAIETMNESTLNLFWRRWVTTLIVRSIHY